MNAIAAKSSKYQNNLVIFLERVVLFQAVIKAICKSAKYKALYSLCSFLNKILERVKTPKIKNKHDHRKLRNVLLALSELHATTLFGPVLSELTCLFIFETVTGLRKSSVKQLYLRR